MPMLKVVGSWRCGKQSFAHGLENHALGPAAVPFAVKNSLPRPQVELATRDRDDDLMAYREGSQMRRGIVLTRPRIVAIAVRLPGGDVLLQPIEDVLPQAGLVIIH